MLQKPHVRQLQSYMRLFLLLCALFISPCHLEASKNKEVTLAQLNRQPVVYYLYVADFIDSFIQITTTPLGGSTTSSTYLAGRAPIYNFNNEKVGTCSASFLCMQNADGIYTDIANFLSVDNGLIVSWFTPTKLRGLELDTIVNSMVTECMVVASTKIVVNPFYGQSFNLIVSSSGGKIYFQFTRTGTIF